MDQSVRDAPLDGAGSISAGISHAFQYRRCTSARRGTGHRSEYRRRHRAARQAHVDVRRARAEGRAAPALPASTSRILQATSVVPRWTSSRRGRSAERGETVVFDGDRLVGQHPTRPGSSRYCARLPGAATDKGRRRGAGGRGSGGRHAGAELGAGVAGDTDVETARARGSQRPRTRLARTRAAPESRTRLSARLPAARRCHRCHAGRACPRVPGTAGPAGLLRRLSRSRDRLRPDRDPAADGHTLAPLPHAVGATMVALQAADAMELSSRPPDRERIARARR